VSDETLAAVEIAVFAIATIACFVASLFADARDWLPSVGCSGAMLLIWAASNILWLLGSIAEWAIVADCVLLGLAMIFWIGVRRRWIGAVVVLAALALASDLCTHVWPIGYAWWSRIANLLYLGQIVAASFPGWTAIFRRTGAVRPSTPAG
jgi:hypothetical protein